MSEREAAREMLRELLHEALAAPNGGGHAGAPPAVPAPPVASVLRPSTWTGPPAGGEVIGGAAEAAIEQVTLETDEDLQRFVHGLLARFEDPRDREAIRAGRLRFALAGAGGAGARGTAAGTLRVERGAVTERKVEEAAKAGARLVLGPGAVLTPLAREKARARGIQIERER
jgi:hypothetical protein